jgi:hypothetical protein
LLWKASRISPTNPFPGESGRAAARWQWDSIWQSAVASKTTLPTAIDDATSSARGAILLLASALGSVNKGLWTAATVAKFAGSIGAEVSTSLALFDQILLEEFEDFQSLIADYKSLLLEEEPMRLALLQHVHRLQTLGDQLRTVQAEGFRLLDEREAFNKQLAARVQTNRYADMTARLSRNEALGQYQNALDGALRFAWLAAQAYDYETALDPGHPAAATTHLETIVRTRQLGHWVDGQPELGQGGLAEILATLQANFETLESQLGINNPQRETGKLSLRRELMRVASDEGWRTKLNRAYQPNLWDVPEFRRYCKYPNEGLAQPGIVLRFSTQINRRRNIFGQELGGGDHAYSIANFATKIRSLGVWFDGYDEAGLSATPRIFLVPIGQDVLRVSDDPNGLRRWNVLEQRIPTPFAINEAHLQNVSFLPGQHSVDGSFTDIRRFGDLRAYPDPGVADSAHFSTDSRLVGRSIWNTQWLLIIPGETLHADPESGLEAFINSVDDIKLQFETYSHSGS